MKEFFGRVRIYFKAMFPLHVNGVAAVLFFTSFFFMVQVISLGKIEYFSSAWFGFLTFFLCMLLPRFFDELKDEGVDAAVFPNRPLVTGAVRYSDVKIMAIFGMIAILLLNLGRGMAIQGLFIYFIFLVLSWQWWLFPEKVSNTLWLVTVTHTPLVPLLNFYIYTVYLEVSGEPMHVSLALPLCMLYWAPILAWEYGRKIRAPEEETDYLTYSKRWGAKKAAFVPLLAILCSTCLWWMTCNAYHFSGVFLYYNLILGASVSLLILRFILKPVKETNIVKKSVESYIILYQAGALVYALLRGV
ncbi:MAG: hypothetical protein KJ737_11640 [Proteobacteria bacterium]|nr:hypothetical protein [Pseudomonadota bacterium]